MNKPANDNAHTTPPIITRAFAAQADAGDLGNLVRFAVPDQVSQHADNDDVASGFAIDTVYEIRPTEGEIERAWKQDLHGIGLRFDKRGRITAYRAHDTSGDPILDEDGNEQWFPAREGYRQSKGARRKSLAELAEESAQILSLRGSGGFPDLSVRSAGPSAGEDFRRLRAAHWVTAMGVDNANARRGMDSLGIGARARFEAARRAVGLPPADRGSTVVARGAAFLAGKTRRNKLATPGSFVGPACGPENVMIASLDAPKLEASLGEHAAVLNEALDGLTARQMADKRGWGTGKAAEQRAVRAQDRALAALAEAQKQAA